MKIGLGLRLTGLRGGAGAIVLPAGVLSWTTESLATIRGTTSENTTVKAVTDQAGIQAALSGDSAFAVTSWPTLAGTLPQVQATAANQPTITWNAAFPSGAALTFDGTNDELANTALNGGTPYGDFTYASVTAYRTTPGTTKSIGGMFRVAGTTQFTRMEFAGSNSSPPSVRISGTNAYSSAGLSHPYSTTADIFVTRIIRRSGTLLTDWVNGVKHLDGVTVVADTIDDYIVTGGFDATWVAGKVVEVHAWPRALSDAEVEQTLAFWAQEYDLLVDQANIVWRGNSLVTGTGSTGGNRGFATLINENLIADGIGHRHANGGAGGLTTTQMVAALATHLAANPGGNLTKMPTIMIACEITNDLHGDGVTGVDAATAYQNYVDYCQGWQAVGALVVAMTCLPRESHGTFESNRALVNADIRDNWETFADVLVDIAADATMGAGPPLNDTYYTDSVHPTDAGYEILRSLIEPAVRSLI